jgi:uncharacterized protein (DUF1778 family)
MEVWRCRWRDARVFWAHLQSLYLYGQLPYNVGIDTREGGKLMATATKPTNQARVDLRTTLEVKAMVERAAAISGTSVSDFITSTVVEKSREVIRENETRVLLDRDRDIFLSLLDAPAAPNDALRSAAAEFKRAVENRDLIP